MYDVTAGHDGCTLVAGDALDDSAIVDHTAVDLEPYAEATLSDDELLAHAAMEAADALGWRGDALDEVLATFDANRHRYPVDQLAVRRTRRQTRRTLRSIGGAA